MRHAILPGLILVAALGFFRVAAAQETSAPTQVYGGALDPSQPADQSLPNPLTHFEIHEEKKTILKLPPSLRQRSVVTDKPHAPALAPVTAVLPTPPRRPKISHASDSFVKKARLQARQDGAAQPIASVAKPSVPRSELIEITPAAGLPAVKPARADALGDTLVQPSLQEILESIDPSAVKTR